MPKVSDRQWTLAQVDNAIKFLMSRELLQLDAIYTIILVDYQLLPSYFCSFILNELLTDFGFP
ncbi:hypothetical protein BDA99DRAFT_554695 [Phascolomyces articulosus]|uniref:Uncharacterized protein n=1 Tax=Phascolomyces articulosus TaxID=60185 RepID=A0AAD5PIH2_9FUNG|nr:hypothetical protein BDA99DRAFT_554695 [Phascolomyces articulosus]